MSAPARIPEVMTAAEFLTWDSQDGRSWQLVDGVPQAMAPAGITHGALQSELNRRIGNHLAESASRCRVITEPGIVPNVRSSHNVRIPDLGVSCAAYGSEESVLTAPVLIVEILSLSNRAETWANVWTYTTIPSVQEIVVLHTVSIAADVLRRRPDGLWPEEPEHLEVGDLTLVSIGFQVKLADLYRTTRLAPR
jgi:Uma2 family endonuclease